MELYVGIFVGIGWNGYNFILGGVVFDGYDVLGNIGEGCNLVFYGLISKKIYVVIVMVVLNYGIFENENIEWYFFIYCFV